jgi:Beta-1,3-glucanase
MIGKVDLKQARMNLGVDAGRTFIFSLTDSTGGTFTPDNVYVAILGSSRGTNVRLDSNGNQVPMRESDNNGPGSITRNGLVYTPSYDMKLSTLQSKGITIGEINSGRIWIGLGSPVYFHIFAGGGFTQPDVANPSDPNADTYFDFAEFSLDASGLHANTSQVDAFGIPMTMNVIGATNKTVGITEPRSLLFSQFSSSVPAEFKGLVDPMGYRINSPKKSPSFNKNYYTDYINEMWSYYQTRDLSISTIFGTYVGRASGDVMTFINSANGSMYKVQKPSSADFIASAGSIVTGDETAKAIKARISAIIQRHVATAPAQNIPSQYYQTAPTNYYSLFWHQHSLNSLAYGFDYDDVFDQSSSINDANPTLMKINVTWG